MALLAQSFDGLGKGKQRIISPARSLILHSCPEAEEVIKLAGTVQAYANTTQIDSEVGPTGRGSATPEQRFRVDPNLLGTIGEGEAFVVSQRRAQLVRVARRVPSGETLLQSSAMLQPKSAARPVAKAIGHGAGAQLAEPGNRVVTLVLGSGPDLRVAG